MNDVKLQYKQIDFLRLFRLCKEMGFVKRKRKMPSQYDNPSHINSSCSKLFKTFLTSLFSDSDIVVESRRAKYSVLTPEGAAERLAHVRAYHGILSNIPKYQEFIRRYNSIISYNSGFIASPVIRDFDSLEITPRPNNGRFVSVSAAIPDQYVSDISRPKEEYYRCARACIEYKELWNNNIGFICHFVDTNRKSIERDIKNYEPNQRVPQSNQRASHPTLISRMHTVHNNNRRNAQEAFNRVLDERRRAR